MSKFELSETEIACGVTMKDTGNTRADSLVLRIPDGLRVVCPLDTPPALAGAAARMALGVPVEFAGFNHERQPVYKPTTEVAPESSDVVGSTFEVKSLTGYTLRAEPLADGLVRLVGDDGSTVTEFATVDAATAYTFGICLQEAAGQPR